MTAVVNRKRKKQTVRKGKKQKDPRETLPDNIKSMDIQTLQREIEVWRQKLFDTKVLRNKNQNEKSHTTHRYEFSSYTCSFLYSKSDVVPLMHRVSRTMPEKE